MACKRELDPDYEDVTEQQTKRQRILEEGAKEATEKRIENIIRRHFNIEIHNKEKEAIELSKHLQHARDSMDRLRACIIAHYYSSLSTSQFKHEQTAAGTSGGLHHTLKKNLIGKAPRAMPSLPARNTCLPSIHSEVKVCADQLERSVTEDASISDRMPSEKLGEDAASTELKDGRESRFTITKQIIVGNVSKYISVDRREPNDQSTHKWMVYVRGSQQEPHIHPFVKKVWFFLHPSYRPNDLVEISEPPFHLTRRGWGEFPVRVQLHFKDPRNKRVDIIHQLKLDKTYTGLQTLGAETIVEIKLDRESMPGYSRLMQIKRDFPRDHMTILTNEDESVDSSVSEANSIKLMEHDKSSSTSEGDNTEDRNVIKRENEDDVVKDLIIPTCVHVSVQEADKISNSQQKSDNNLQTVKTIAMNMNLGLRKPGDECVSGTSQQSNNSTSNAKKVCIKYQDQACKLFLVPQIKSDLSSSAGRESLTQATVTVSNSTPQVQSLITSPSNNVSTSYPVISLMPKVARDALSPGVSSTIVSSSSMVLNNVQSTAGSSMSKKVTASTPMVSLMPSIIKSSMTQNTDIAFQGKSKTVSLLATDSSRKVIRLISPKDSCAAPTKLLTPAGTASLAQQILAKDISSNLKPATTEHRSTSIVQTGPRAMTKVSDTLLTETSSVDDFNTSLVSVSKVSKNASLVVPGYPQKNAISLLPKNLKYANGSRSMLMTNALKTYPSGNTGTLKVDALNIPNTNSSFQQQMPTSAKVPGTVSQVLVQEPSTLSSPIPSVPSEQFFIANVDGKRCLLKLLPSTSDKLSNSSSALQYQKTQTAQSGTSLKLNINHLLPPSSSSQMTILNQASSHGNMSYINPKYIKSSELKQTVSLTNSKTFTAALKDSKVMIGLNTLNKSAEVFDPDFPLQDVKPCLKSILGLSKRKSDTTKASPAPVNPPKRNLPTISVAAAADMSCLMRMAVKHFPIVRADLDRAHHSYCAQSTEQWLQWPVGKKRASEWMRASAIRQQLLQLVGGEGIFKGQPLWTRKQIMYWCRQHASSPHFLEPAIDQLESSITMTTIPDRVNSFSLPEEYLKPLEVLELNGTQRTKSCDKEIDIIGDELPRVKIKCEPESPEKTGVTSDVLAPHESVEYVMDSAQQIGIEIDYTELEPGILGRVTHHMIYASMLAFTEDILREAFAAGSSDNSYATELSVLNICKGLSSFKSADFLTNANLGVLPDSSTSARLPVSR